MAVKTKGLFKAYVEPFGWLNSLYLLAEKGVFNKPTENRKTCNINQKPTGKNLQPLSKKQSIEKHKNGPHFM